MSTTASARPPGTIRISRCRVRSRSSAMRVFSMTSPMKMNMGAATRTALSMVPEKMRLGSRVAWTRRMSPVQIAISPKIRLMPISMIATGAPENRSTMSDRNIAPGRAAEMISTMAQRSQGSCSMPGRQSATIARNRTANPPEMVRTAPSGIMDLMIQRLVRPTPPGLPSPLRKERSTKS